MQKHNHHAEATVDSLATDARALLTATKDLAGRKVELARERLNTALDAARTRTLEGVQATDEVVREHPYHAIGIALGVGALVGFLVARRE